MIDATKLVDLQEYWILFSDKAPRIARYFETHSMLYALGGLTYEPGELTDAIPIPSPDELGVMREVLQDVVETVETQYVIGDETYNKARTLLEKMT